MATSFNSMPASPKSQVLNSGLFAYDESGSQWYAIAVNPTTGALIVEVAEPPALALIDGGVAHSYTTGNVTTGAWVQLIAATSADITKLILSDTGGRVMELAVGAAASEQRIALIPEGASNLVLDLTIPAGSRLAVRAISATANAGYLVINTLG